MTTDKDERGIRRTLRRVERRYPGRFARFLRWLRRPGSRWVRIPLAALGYLSPVVAGGAMALSSVSVMANALLLRRWRAQRPRTTLSVPR